MWVSERNEPQPLKRIPKRHPYVTNVHGEEPSKVPNYQIFLAAIHLKSNIFSLPIRWFPFGCQYNSPTDSQEDPKRTTYRTKPEASMGA